MKKLKFLFLIAIPVFLLSCGETNTRKGVNGVNDEGGMGGRDKEYNVQRDMDNSGVNQGVQRDTTKYRGGTQQQRGNDNMMGTPDPSNQGKAQQGTSGKSQQGVSGRTQQGVRDTAKLRMNQDSSKKGRNVIK